MVNFALAEGRDDIIFQSIIRDDTRTQLNNDTQHDPQNINTCASPRMSIFLTLIMIVKSVSRFSMSKDSY